MTLSIEHSPEHSRFEITVKGHLCVADYELAEDIMVMTHTEVSPALQGQGIAAALVEAALAHARSHKLKVRPQCSYVLAYMQRHPETESLRA